MSLADRRLTSYVSAVNMGLIKSYQKRWDSCEFHLGCCENGTGIPVNLFIVPVFFEYSGVFELLPPWLAKDGDPR